jgi:hypothetical protein
MGMRTRKFIGVIATAVFLCLYSLIAMVVGARLFIDVAGWMQLPAFIVLGIAWLPVVMKIIKWMERPEADPGQSS